MTDCQRLPPIWFNRGHRHRRDHHTCGAGGQSGDFDAAFATAAQLRAAALVISTPEPWFGSHAAQLGTLALHHSVPAIYFQREFAAAGGLMSYGGSITDTYRLAGLYAGRILKGEK